MRTVSAKKEDAQKNRRWYVVDAQDMVLGRLASRVAGILRGKNKPEYTPHVDTGDFVIVVNARKVRLTGRKESDKLYHHHTGWVGGLVSEPAAELRQRFPDRIIKQAVKGMLPKGPLGRAMVRKLKVYADGEHPHRAQNPEALAV